MARSPTRRELLLRGAAALAAAGAPGLFGGGAAFAAPPATSIAELRRRLRGTLLRPTDAGWGDAKALYNPRLDVSPRAIAFCETAADVSEVVRFARRRGWPVAARGGRHSFAGYCNAIGGIVADVSRLDARHARARPRRSPTSAAARTCSTSTATSSCATVSPCRSGRARRSASRA